MILKNPKRKFIAFLLTATICVFANAQYQISAVRTLLSVFSEFISVSLPLKKVGRSTATISASVGQISLKLEKEVGKSGIKISTTVPLDDFQAIANAMYLAEYGRKPLAKFDETSGIFIVVTHNNQRSVFVSDADPICIANLAEVTVFTVSLRNRYVEVPVSTAVSDVIFGGTADACKSIQSEIENRRFHANFSTRRQGKEQTSNREVATPQSPTNHERYQKDTLCTVRLDSNSRQIGEYFGECKNGFANGHGTVSFYTPRPINFDPNQAISYGNHIYQGNFVDGMASGRGNLRAPQVGLFMDGEFQFGIPVSGTGAIYLNGQSRRFRLTARGLELE